MVLERVAQLQRGTGHSFLGEAFGPADAAGGLHGDEERGDGADGDGQACEASEKEGVGEDDEIDELAERGFPEGEPAAGDQAQIGGDEGDGDG